MNSKPVKYDGIVGQVHDGSSLRLSSNSIFRPKKAGAVAPAYVIQMSGKKISKSVQYLTAVLLQIVSNVLQDHCSWGFAIAFERATNNGEAFINGLTGI